MVAIDPLMRKAVAEFIGIFAFFFVGIGAVINGSETGLLGVAAAHGVMLAIMISTLGAISGGHFNPAVTFGLFMGRQIDGRTLGYYWVAQVLGAIAAAIAIKIALPSSQVDVAHVGAPDFTDISWIAGLFLEAVLTFFLVLSVYGTAIDPRHPPIGGFGIGLTVFVGVLVAGPHTGGAMNPARALGPAIVGNYWAWSQIAYWIGPLLGGAIAGIVYMLYFWPERAADSEGPSATALWWYLPLMRLMSGVRAAGAARGQVARGGTPPAATPPPAPTAPETPPSPRGDGAGGES